MNTDGTLRGGAAKETYGPADVSNLARIFTGYNLNSPNKLHETDPQPYRVPMVLTAADLAGLGVDPAALSTIASGTASGGEPPAGPRDATALTLHVANSSRVSPRPSSAGAAVGCCSWLSATRPRPARARGLDTTPS